MRYLFQNVHKSRKTVHDLLDSRQNSTDILFIQEAPINFIHKVPSATNPEGDDLKGPVHHKAWQCIDRQLTFDDSAVAIYLNKCIMTTHQAIVNDSIEIHKDVLVVQVTNNKLRNMDFTLINVYNRPGSGNRALNSLLQVVPTITNIAVVQGDFNLHSPLWDERISRGSGLTTELFNNLSDCSLNLVNDEGSPTWTNGKGSFSVIDLLFCNDRLVALDPLLDVSLDNRGRSDHALISFIFGRQVPRLGCPFIVKDSEEEDSWCDLVGGLLSALTDFVTKDNVEDTCAFLVHEMTNKWSELAKTPLTSRPHSQLWWNNQCHIHRDVYNATRSPDDLRLYNAVTRKARNAFFDDKLREMSANKKPWEGVRWTRPRPPPSFTTIVTDGRNVTSTEELFDVMHAQFSKASTRHLDPNVAATLIDATPQFHKRESMPISSAEVREALSDTSDSSSPGPDKITWRILKKATWINGVIEGLASLYNCSVESGIWPDWFKSSESVIIPKPNKPNYTIPKVYRPISLLNTVGKLLTKIIANCMQFDAVAYGLLHPGQCGGIRKHATIDAGVVLASFITNTKEAGLHTTACTFDISQFFLSLDHRVTALILTRLGFDDKLVTLLGSYFRDQTTFYRWDSATSKPYDFSVGTPQGDCISPVLSALYLSITLKASVPIPFPPPNVRSLFFVDDGLLYAASRSLKQNASRIERKLQEVTTALACIGLYIEADKTELIHFPGYVLAGTGPRHAEILNRPSITVNDGNSTFVVKPKDCIRYLGFYFSSTLDWNAHIRFYFNRAFSTIRAFKMLGSSIRGLDTLQCRNAYQACVLSVLTYGLPLWYAPNGKGVSRHIRLIAKVHSYATQWITGAFRTTPNGAKEMIAGLPPLITILNQRFHGYRARIVTLPPAHILVATMNNKWTNPAYSHVSPKTRPSHLPSDDPFKRLCTHLVREQFEYFADVQQPGRRCVDLFPGCVVIDTSSPKKASKFFKAWVRNLKTETQTLHSLQDLVVYTDGAYHHADNRASYAVCTTWHSTWSDFTDWCPAALSFDSEMRAIEKAIEIITSSNARRTHLFCDNKAAV
ncbi:hypothetical protein AX14_003852 [Amanita brunnescens Koide BX004]|nr:hypothetical protein AX14_003852 [Amanita brunnescens Koide BX004]